MADALVIGSYDIFRASYDVTVEMTETVQFRLPRALAT